HRDLLPRIHQLERTRVDNDQRIDEKLMRFSGILSASDVRGLERLAGARARLLESEPQTRREMLSRWLDKVVQPARSVSIGRSGKRFVLVTSRRAGGVIGVREDGRPASFPLERIGRVFAPIFSARPDKTDDAFD